MSSYAYSVARVRAKENDLLTMQDLEQLLSADGYRAALRVLQEKGYQDTDAVDSGSVLIGAEQAMWSFLEEVADDTLLTLLRLPADYHNLKASVKAVFSAADLTGLLRENGTVPSEQIEAAIRNHDYRALPSPLSDAAEEAMSILVRLQDGQVCDVFLDNALLAALEQTAADAGKAFFREYAALTADLSNLKTALRCAIMQKNADFIAAAIYSGGTLSTAALSAAIENGVEAVYAFVENSAYQDGVASMKQSPAAFEKWCSDRMMREMERARYDCFSAAPILAYAYAKQTEFQAVRMILSAKQNHLDDRRIRERVRRLYVSDCSSG